uniref:Integrase catalytic domain-containing protein n=1 Tax=Tanacetum cinerariifolium TaxID=118510 RepID=A0A6L2JEE9_TANCI|nr:hypothetical protein [Tanacetum cinerariifolium]
MHGMRKMVNELHDMLNQHEQTLSKRDALALHAIRAGKVQKKHKNKKPQLAARRNNQGKKKSKLAYAPKSKIPPPPKKEDPAKDSGLKGSRKLKPRALSLYMGNGQRAAVESIRSYELCFPISRNNLVYFSAIPMDGIYKIDLSLSNTNNHSIKKRIEKLQQDRLLNSIDTKSFQKCVSCLSGKVAQKLYSHQVERAKDLLGLIHIDHKHEVFETFSVFQKEVENQLGKTIKLLRSDREAKYMSQEFLDHLKEHGIISHHTPPYTRQHNGVSERRNRTLLDMVHFMMSQKNISKSFWDYALESAARILNMVSTKKVEKTPYEDLVDLPPNGKTIGSKWLFKKKTDMDGAVRTYKARLVTKGYTQTLRIDYEETFSPVVDIRAIRILIAIAAFYDYEIWQMDVKNAFFNGYRLHGAT